MNTAQTSAFENPDIVLPASVPLLPLSDGNSIPQLGFGVWKIENDKVGEAVGTAIEAGYRSIDTAQGYDNETGVGAAIAGQQVPREELFITSKLRTKAMGYDGALKGVEESLAALRLDYLDMMLIHWPTPAFDAYPDTWKGLIQARKDGLVRSIGVANFLVEHLERIMDETGVKPAVNQIELHPYYQQRDVRDYHARQGIQLECYSPLGSGAVLKDPVIAEIGRKHGKSVAQTIIRWHLQQDLVVIPKSETPERIRQNIEVFDFTLDDEDMERIAALDNPRSGKTLDDPASFNNLY